jgi:hypothetical protein
MRRALEILLEVAPRMAKAPAAQPPPTSAAKPNGGAARGRVVVPLPTLGPAPALELSTETARDAKPESSPEPSSELWIVESTAGQKEAADLTRGVRGIG